MSVRVDKWLWAVRAFKTRTKSNDACTNGRVLVNNVVAKPATKIKPGDVVTANRRDRQLVYTVLIPIEKRVSAARAAECLEDHSPPPVPRTPRDISVFARRDRGTGRPTKRDRRQIDRLRGRQTD